MLPALLSLGPLAITSLGFCLFIGFLLSSFLVWHRGKEENFDAEPLMDAFFICIFFAFISGRVVYALVNNFYGWNQWYNFFSFPGFSYFGFLGGGLAALAVMSRKNKWDFWQTGDVFAIAAVGWQIFARVGNFFDGSYIGKTSTLPWAIRFPGLDKPVQPINLYEILFLFCLYYILRKLERQYRMLDWYKNKRGEALSGFLLFTYLILYSLFRFLLEFLHDSHLYLFSLSWEQWISIFILIFGVAGLYLRSGRGCEDVSCVQKKVKLFVSGIFGGHSIEILIPFKPQKKTAPQRQGNPYKAGMDIKK